MKRLQTIRTLVAVPALIVSAWLPTHANSGFTPPARLVVVTDDNYPPYLFRNAEGQLQGILKEKWDLWSQKSGVPVQLEGMEWAKAQQSVLAGTADIIDALSYTEARTRLYEYSPPYAEIEARVFFHQSISGINDVASMRGFTIGAKDGSACGNWLKDRGVEAIRGYPNSEFLVRAAGAGEIQLFCMDTPAAQYFLFKQGLADQFRQAPPLYSSHFHWAAAKGRAELRDFVQRGYELITAEELRDIDTRWTGNRLKAPIDTRLYYYLAILIAGILSAASVLALWNRTLRLRVAARTAQLNGQTQVLEMIAAGLSLEKTLDTLVRVVEAPSRGMFGSVLLLDEDGVHLRHGAAPSLPESYVRAIDGAAIGERAGSCGTAAFRRELVIVEDIATDPLWEDYRTLAQKHGLRACWSSPIFDAHRRVLGTFALYYSEPRKPVRRHFRLIEMATHAAAIAITKQREQNRMSRLNRINSVLSSINSAIVHIKERQKLLEEACRIAVEHGKFGIAWIGLLDPKSLDIDPVAIAGIDADSLVAKSRNSANPDTPLGQGIVGRAIRERRVVFSNDITTESTYGGARRQEAIRRGYRSLISLPLLLGGESIGSLSLFAMERNFFDEEEIRLLAELAGDISFALEYMAQQEKIAKHSRIRVVSGEVNAAILRIRERKALLEETCHIAAKHGKFEMVWVASLDTVNRSIAPVAWTGFSDKAAHAVNFDSISTARGTLGEAIETRRLAVRNDIEIQYSGGRLREEALERGYRSTVCLPLLVDDQAVALVVLYAVGPGFFDEDELALLSELTADISLALQMIEKQEKLEYLSFYDTITGLPNRTLFVDRTGQQMRSRGGEPLMVALILFNIERFRYINETFGRHGGDELLRLVAKRLESAFGNKDYLARIGADTFGVVIRGMRDASAVAHAVETQILGCFKEPYRLYSNELRVVAKAGIAIYPADGGDATPCSRTQRRL